MQKVAAVFIVFFMVLAGVSWSALNSPWLTLWLVRTAVTSSVPVVKIASMSIGRQEFLWPSRFEFNNVTFDAMINGKALFVSCPRLEVDIQGLAPASRELWFQVDGATLDYGPGQAKNIRAAVKVLFPDKGPVVLQGPVSAQSLVWDKAQARRASTVMAVDTKGLHFDALKGEAFGGTFAGGVNIFLSKPAGYSIRLALKNMDAAELASVNPQIEEQVNGRFSGSVNFDGTGDRLTDFQSDLTMPDGGRVNAALLAALTQYLPATMERDRLDALIRVGGKLAVEVFALKVKSDTPGHLTGQITLTSKEANLKINVTPDIYVDGTWEDLLQSWGALFEQYD